MLAYFFFFPKAKSTVGNVRDFNVLLITLDTTRADKIGAYGYDKAKTPNIDTLASKGVKFVNAYCQVPLTLPSHCSIFTGTYPLYHHVHNNGFYYLDEDQVTLAEVLKSNNFQTAAFVSSFTVDSRFGIGQGFDYFDDTFLADEMFKNFRSERPAEKVFESFRDWLDEHSKNKFFCWVHFYDPHLPYFPPSPYREEFSDSPYDGEIAYMDFYVGKTIEKLKEQGVFQKTLIILAGDHGEAFGENGESDHGLFLYNSTLKVPLVFHAENKIPPGLEIPSSVRLIDIMPSILDMLGVEVPDKVQGTSLLPYIDSQKEESLPSYIETVYPKEYYGWSELSGLVEKEWKYIRAPKPELYNLLEDPEERNNLFFVKKKIADDMSKNLDRMIQEYAIDVDVQTRKLSLEEQERLRSLGYVGGATGEKRSETELPDPKDKLEEFSLIHQARMAVSSGEFEEAAEKYRRILDLNPDVPWNYVNLAVTLNNLEKSEAAIQILEQGLNRVPESFVLLSRLGHFHLRAGNFEKAFEISQAALRIDPQYIDAILIAGWAVEMKGDWLETSEYFRKALEIEPENKFALLKYAYSIAAQSKTQEALEIYAGLKEKFPDDYKIYSDLGVIYNSIGNTELAYENIKKAVELNPFYETYLSYAAILERRGDLREAVRYLKLYLENTSEGETQRKIGTRNTLAAWERKLK